MNTFLPSKTIHMRLPYFLNIVLPETVDDWQYFSISPHIKAHWEPYGDDLYELVMLVSFSQYEL